MEGGGEIDRREGSHRRRTGSSIDTIMERLRSRSCGGERLRCSERVPISHGAFGGGERIGDLRLDERQSRRRGKPAFERRGRRPELGIGGDLEQQFSRRFGLPGSSESQCSRQMVNGAEALVGEFSSGELGRDRDLSPIEVIHEEKELRQLSPRAPGLGQGLGHCMKGRVFSKLMMG
jgi:hypothetical protein